MKNEIFSGIRLFALLFGLIYLLNLLDIRIFAEALYTSEGVMLGLLFVVINYLFVKL